MSNNHFVNIEQSTATNYNNETLVIKIINVSSNTKQTHKIEQSQSEKLIIAQHRSRIQLLKYENTNILQTNLKLRII